MVVNVPARSSANRNANRRMLYRYARDVLNMSVRSAKDAAASVSWLIEQFPDHQFPVEILAMCGRGSYARKLAYQRMAR